MKFKCTIKNKNYVNVYGTHVSTLQMNTLC